MNSFEIVFRSLNGNQESIQIDDNETNLDLSNRRITEFDFNQLLKLKKLHLLNLSQNPLQYVNLTPLFLLQHLSQIILDQETYSTAHWMFRYALSKPTWFNSYSHDIKWDEDASLEELSSLYQIQDVSDLLLKMVEKNEFERKGSIKICGEVLKVLSSNYDLRKNLTEKKLRQQIEHARWLKREAIVSSIQETTRSPKKLLCILIKYTKKKLYQIQKARNWVKLESINDCGEPTKNQHYKVSAFLKEYQNQEQVQKLDVLFTSILTIFLAISIGLVLYYRILYQSFLNTMMANLAIPSVVVSLILPFMHSFSKYHNRIDYRVAVGKIMYLYITNILVVGISFLIYTWIGNSLVVLRLSFEPYIIDLLSLFLLSLFIIVWIHMAYVFVELKEISWLESVFNSSKTKKRYLEEENPCFNEVETFVIVGSTYTHFYPLLWIFTLLNLSFVWSTLKGLYLYELGESIDQLLPAWQLLVFIPIAYLIWKILWMVINGRITQVRLVEKFLSQNESE